jgi:predicted negative regulator of RcsB-dependent stress response
MSEATQTQTLEQTLNKTDLGHIIYEKRNLFISLIVAILVAVLGYVFWNQSKETKALETSVQVFDFQEKTWKGAKEGKVSLPELVKTFDNLDQSVKSAPVMVPVGLEMGKFLAEKNALVEADSILSQLNTTHPISSFFVAMQRAVVLEKLNKIPEAIAVLEKVAQDKESLMAAKVNLELGRLNLANGDKGKAQTHFTYVESTYPNDEHAKLAKLYLAKLAQ